MDSGAPGPLATAERLPHHATGQRQNRDPGQGPPAPLATATVPLPQQVLLKERSEKRKLAMLTNALSLGDRVATLTCGDRMKKALALVAEGMPYRDAAKEAGYRDHREVYRWAKRAGLLAVHSEQLVAVYKRIASLSNAELERRLIEHPEDIATRDLVIVSGVAADKAAKYENWGKPQEPDRSEFLGRMLERIQSMGATEIRLEVTHPQLRTPLIDVGRG